MYPPVIIISGGKYPGKEWDTSNIEKNKDREAAELLNICREK